MLSHILNIAFSVAGSIIGAGFATGKELQLFFPLHDIRSLLYLGISLLIMAIISALYFHRRNNTSSLRFSKGFDLFFTLFSGASCIVMFACGGETLKEVCSLPIVWGNILTFLLTLWIVSKGIESVYRFNLVATPILMASILLISLAGLSHPVGLFSKQAEPSFQMLIYTGYNLLSTLPFLSAIADHTQKKDGIRGIVLGFSFVLLCGLLIKILLNVHHNIVCEAPLPMLKIVGMIHPLLAYVYTVMLSLSVLTTAVNALYAVTRGTHTLTIASGLLLCSFFGFTALLEHLYPFFGYIGIGITVLVLWDTYFEKEKENICDKRKKHHPEYHFRKPGKAVGFRGDGYSDLR